MDHNTSTDISLSELYCSENPHYTPHPESDTRSNADKVRTRIQTPYFTARSPTEPEFLTTQSSDDPLLDDSRTIHHMIVTENNRHATSSLYLLTSGVNDSMRKILLRWMYEVSFNS